MTFPSRDQPEFQADCPRVRRAPGASGQEGKGNRPVGPYMRMTPAGKVPPRSLATIGRPARALRARMDASSASSPTPD
jgi:hypothetical protein